VLPYADTLLLHPLRTPGGALPSGKLSHLFFVSPFSPDFRVQFNGSKSVFETSQYVETTVRASPLESAVAVWIVSLTLCLPAA